MRESVTLRPVCSNDEAFVLDLFRSAHKHTFASLDMPEEENELLRMQFKAQQSQYRSQYPDARFDLVLKDEVAIGTLYAMRGPEKFVLIDIMLLAEHRNAGIGAKLVKKLIREANAAKKALQAHVLKTNPACRLWRRLGFEIVADDGVYLQIRVSAG
jgi:ribosomal protein S18 acetylase RimI-like enzyme